MRARRRQAGQALLEWMIAAALTLLLVVWGASRWRDQADTVRDEAVGRWLDAVGAAMADMMQAEFAGLSDPHGQMQHAYAQRWMPTIDELKRHGYLPAAFPVRAAWGQTASIRLWTEGACPQPPCQLQGVAFLASSAPAFSRKASVLAQLGGHGGLVWPQRPAQLRGGTFTLPNPLPDGSQLPAGSVAVYRALNAARLHDFVRVRDTRDPDLQGDLTVAGRTQVGAGLAAGGRLETDEFLRLGGAATAGAACEPGGLLAREALGEQLLLCTNGSWRRATTGHFGGMFYLNHRFGCRTDSGESGANPLTGQCSCPAGYQPRRISVLPAVGDLGMPTQVFLCQR